MPNCATHTSYNSAYTIKRHYSRVNTTNTKITSLYYYQIDNKYTF